MQFCTNIVRKWEHMREKELRAVFYARVSTEEEEQLNAIENRLKKTVML